MDDAGARGSWPPPGARVSSCVRAASSDRSERSWRRELMRRENTISLSRKPFTRTLSCRHLCTQVTAHEL